MGAEQPAGDPGTTCFVGFVVLQPPCLCRHLSTGLSIVMSLNYGELNIVGGAIFQGMHLAPSSPLAMLLLGSPVLASLRQCSGHSVGKARSWL